MTKVSKADLEIFVDPPGKPLPFSEVTGSKGKADKEKVGDRFWPEGAGTL